MEIGMLKKKSVGDRPTFPNSQSVKMHEKMVQSIMQIG